MNRSGSGAAVGLAAVLALWAAPAQALEAPALTLTGPRAGAVVTAVTVSGSAAMGNPLNDITAIRVEVRSTIGAVGPVSCDNAGCGAELGGQSTSFTFSPPLAFNGPYEATASATGVELIGIDIDGPETTSATRAFKVAVRPAVPKDVKAQANPDRTVTVSWAPNTEPDLIGYQVQRKGPGASGFEVVDSVAQSSGSRPSLVDAKPAEAGGRFEYVVLAVRRGADGTTENPLSAVSAPSVVSVAGPDGITPPAGGGSSPSGGTTGAGGSAALDVSSFLSAAGGRGAPRFSLPGVAVPDGGFSQTLPLAVPGQDDPALTGEDGDLAIEQESASSGRRGIFVPVAAGLLLLVAAGHLRWLSRRMSAASAAAELQAEPVAPPEPGDPATRGDARDGAAALAPVGGKRRRRRSHLGDDEVSQVVLGPGIDDLLAAGPPTDDRKRSKRSERQEPVATTAADIGTAVEVAAFRRPDEPQPPVGSGAVARRSPRRTGRIAEAPDEVEQPGEAGEPDELPAESIGDAEGRSVEPPVPPFERTGRQGRRARRAAKNVPAPRSADLDARFEILVAGAEADLDAILGSDEAKSGSFASRVTTPEATTAPTPRPEPGPNGEAPERAVQGRSARQLAKAEVAAATTSRAAAATEAAATEAATSRAAAADAAADDATSRAAAAQVAADAATSRADAATSRADAADAAAAAATSRAAAAQVAADAAANDATSRADAAADASTSRAAAADAAATDATSRAAAAQVAADAATSRAATAAIEAAAIEAAANEAAATIQAAAAAEAAAAKEAAAAIKAAAAAEAAAAKQAAATIEAAATTAAAEATEAAIAAVTIAATEAASAEATSAAVAAATLEATAAVAAATEAAVAAITTEATEAAVAAATEAAVTAATIAATEAAVVAATAEATEAAVAAATIAATTAATEAAVAVATIEATDAAVAAATDAAVAAATDAAVAAATEAAIIAATDAAIAAVTAIAETAAAEEAAQIVLDDLHAADVPDEQSAFGGEMAGVVGTPSAFGFGEGAGDTDAADAVEPGWESQDWKSQDWGDPVDPELPDQWADLLDAPESVLQADDEGPTPAGPGSWGAARDDEPDEDAWDSVVLVVRDPPTERD